jgi:phosphoglycerate dehydrogenase-like enzyme
MNLRIFTDISAPESTMQVLREGTAPHELLVSRTQATSCLEQALTDPQLYLAEVAFGQPDPEAILLAKDLRWIQISSSSITRYDTLRFRRWILERGIAVCNSAAVYAEACADHTLAFMLAQSRLLPESLTTRAHGGSDAWHRIRGNSVPLRGKSVLVVGYGAIGARLVELLRPFEMNITAVRRSIRGDEPVPVVPVLRLDEILARGWDHVVDILPDSGETVRFFNAERFARMKRGTVFYNIGRGSTVDQDALLDALRSGHISTAWLDVTEPEPLPEHHPLLSQPNCFITPHVAGGHKDESVTVVRHFLANLGRFDRGEPLKNRVL